MGKTEPTDENICSLKGIVHDLAYLGNMSIYRIGIDDKVIQITMPNLQRQDQREIEWDDEVYISWQRSNAIMLSR